MTTALPVLDDRFRLERRLGEGSQGVAFVARDLRASPGAPLLALKLLPSAAGQDHVELALLDEYRLLATLRHPHLLPVYEVGRVAEGEWAGRLYFTAELLEVAASARTSSAEELLSIAEAASSALGFLHDHGLWHRDVKPENLGRAADGTLRLFDLGLAARAPLAASAAGSLPFAAPELFFGLGDHRSDLYSLGATLVALRTGELPLLPGGRPLWLADAAARRATLTDRLRGLPTGFVNLVDTLLAPDPAARPQAADEVVAAVARLRGETHAERHARRLRRPLLIGRDRELEAARQILLDPGGGILVLGAPAGQGAHRFVQELSLRLHLDALTARRSLDWIAVGASHSSASATLGDGDLARRREAALAWQAARRPGVVLCLWPDAPRELRDLARRGQLRPAAVLLIEDEAAPPAPEGAAALSLPPLDEAAGRQLVEEMLPLDRALLSPQLVQPLLARADGRPAHLVALVRRLYAGLAGAPLSARAVEAALDGETPLPLPPAGAISGALLWLVSLGEQQLRLPRAAELLARPLGEIIEAAAQLRDQQWLAHSEATLRFIAVEWRGRVLPIDEERRLADAIMARLDGSDSPLLRAELTALRGASEGASEQLLAVADSSPAWQRVAARVLAHHDDARLRVRLAAALALASKYDAALALLDAGGDATEEARLLASEIELRLGRNDAALARLAGLEAGRNAERAAALRGRAAFQSGRWREAEAAVIDCRAYAPAVETLALAQIYAGRHVEAEATLDRLSELVATPVARARMHSIRGMVAHLRGRLAEAVREFSAALELARSLADLHSEAVYTANLAAALREQGHFAEALLPTERATELLGAFGRPGELGMALLNRGNLELSLGDPAAAARHAEAALRVAERAGDARLSSLAHNLLGDTAARAGELGAAEERYRQAWRLASSDGERLIVAANLVDTAIAAHQAPLRDEWLRVVEGLPAGSAAERVRRERALLVGALATDPARGRPSPAAQASLAAAIEEVSAEGRLPDALRGQLALTRGWLSLEDASSARLALLAAASTWEKIVKHIPPARLSEASTDPDVEKLRLLQAAAPTAATAPTSAASSVQGTEPGAVERLLEIIKRLNAESRLELLLEFILDAAIELVHAERAFILLDLGDGGGGGLQVAAARNLDRADLISGPAEYSRSIAERAAMQREVIVSLDAIEDRRFESSRSVAALHVRSVLAVPLESRSRLLGCLYLDHRLRTRAFSDRDVALVRGLADHAANAIDKARLQEDERRQREEVVRLNRELADRVSLQDEELSALRREVRQGRQALELRYNYDNLVGRSPAMLELFRLLDRVTDTNLPVVIYGESGTGKELVARAIHHNGSRAKRPFVGESCAAIPDTLLESILFGHVKGAFTGADSERRGLFEVASGGTLFLDEVGEMSPSMQSKLLRVLQQGELRRVGSEKTIRVDVRIVVASNRDLQQLVSAGSFREDLFYRLNVVRVALPALRQRTEDIPLLVDHFLRKVAETGQRPMRKVARAAMDRLITYAWPGNVRELENEVLRAAALGGELISVGDLSPHIAAGSLAADVSASATFDLKERVERLERALLREAMERAGGNQSKAAELLGLSRFGLSKKLKRYRLST